jgi:hypothetical protein
MVSWFYLRNHVRGGTLVDRDTALGFSLRRGTYNPLEVDLAMKQKIGGNEEDAK